MKGALLLRRFAWIALALVMAWLLSLTLRPGPARNEVHLALFSEKWPALVCLWTGCSAARSAFQFLYVDLLGNIAVFVPFGAALAATLYPSAQPGRAGRVWPGRGWLVIAALGCLFSVSIELAQLFVPGRTTDMDDVVLNTAGALVGAALLAILRLAIRKL